MNTKMNLIFAAALAFGPLALAQNTGAPASPGAHTSAVTKDKQDTQPDNDPLKQEKEKYLQDAQKLADDTKNHASAAQIAADKAQLKKDRARLNQRSADLKKNKKHKPHDH
ncbi:MAG TPA: hypothetical protein VNV88_10755 [Candidatus Solibacter sp.]|jgi:hypothetical protein|nr:hypothetical protein [Candidatus Solibacter sp.]